jgi:hypothetical protein
VSAERFGAATIVLALACGLADAARAAPRSTAVPQTPVATQSPAATQSSGAIRSSERARDATPASSDMSARIRRLDVADSDSADDELRALAAAGESAATAALEGFAQAEPRARRRRAWLVRQAGGGACARGAIENLSDVDPLVRGELIEFLGRIELLQSELEARVAALAQRALADPDESLRSAALAALAEIGEPVAIERLDQLLDVLAPRERAAAARLLAQNPHAAGVVQKRVRAACASPAGTVSAVSSDGEALANLLSGYGRCLADAPSGAAPLDLAPFIVFARSADVRIRAAAAVAFETWLRRLALRGDGARIERDLVELQSQGFDARLALYQRARLSSLVGDDPAVALRAARELESVASAAADREGRTWLARALLLEACARIAGDASDEAGAPIARAEAVLDGLLAERVDLEGKGVAEGHVQCLHERALCELTEAVRKLALACPSGERAGAADLPLEVQHDVAEILRRMHVVELEAELAAWRADAGTSGSLDPLLEAEQGPLALVLENPRSKSWPAARSLRVRELLGRALKSVAPGEAPGFEAFGGLADETGDPLKDPERRALLQRLQYARLDALSKELTDLFEAISRHGVTDAAQLSGSEERRIRELQYEMDRMVASIQNGEKNGWRDLEELRVPSWFALSLARELRNDGQSAHARALAQAMRADLEQRDVASKYLWGLEIQAEIEMTTGTSYTDDGDPKQAEVELVKAVERLEALEKLVQERDFGAAAIARLQGLRCNALVSLAVNANVKQGDTQKAVAYFERAWALRHDDSMRVLLACYRARQGRGAEARTLLRSVTPTPLVHYNLACTWALLGEKELALEFLRREMQESQLSPGGLAKQKEWARGDPDLKSLRDDARFRELVAP